MEHAFDIEPEASLVARVDGELVGLGNLGLRGADAWVGGVGVVPAHRGTGLGEALMRGLIAAAAARGVARLWLEVIVENTAAVRLYEKLAFAHVRDVEVWSLPGKQENALLGSVADAQAWIRERPREREPWQRADGTIARLAALDPPPQGVLIDRGAAIVRVSAGRVSLLQLAGETDQALRDLLIEIQVLGESVLLLNLASDDPAEAAFRELGGAVVVRQHEMLLELDAA